jgi:hypothetical protein
MSDPRTASDAGEGSLMRKMALVWVVALLGLLTSSCQQEVLSETSRPLGPNMKANNNLAQGQARNGPVLTPQAQPSPQEAAAAAAAKPASPDVWDWLTGVFEGPSKPAAQPAPMMSQPVQPAASLAPATPKGQVQTATP